MIDAKNARYALWLMPGLGDDPTEGVSKLANDVITWRGGLSECIDTGELEHWEEGVGTLAWDRLTASNRRMVIAWAPYGGVSASDQALNERIDTAQLALMLASDHCRHHGDNQVLMGEAASIQPVRLSSVNRVPREHRLRSTPLPDARCFLRRLRMRSRRRTGALPHRSLVQRLA